MLESEAKKCACIGPENCGVLTPPDGHKIEDCTRLSCRRLCVGSGCLAWRWVNPFVLGSVMPADERQGYCTFAIPAFKQR